MISYSIDRLQYLCNIIPPLLLKINAGDFKTKPTSTRWSKQEILGHLIDSATNNHQRFIRVQYEDVPYIRYDQDQWVNLSHYNELLMTDIVEYWRRYNLHLLHIMKHLDLANLSRFCNTGGENPVTLEFLINDYVVHLEHHLRQIVKY